nr:hypothetical protein [Tanacetum cinerariifolium]
MNYQPVVAGNQPNHSAGIKENLDAGKVRKDTESAQQYVLLPLCFTSSQDPQNIDADVAFDVKENENEVHVSPSSSDKPHKHDEKAKREAKGKSLVDLTTGVRDLRADFEEFLVNSTNRVNAVSAPVIAVGPNPTNSTNSFNVASPSDNAVSPNFKIGGKSSFVDPSQYLDDLDMPALEDIVYSYDEEDVGVEADFSNLETNISVSPITTTRVHKDHPVSQITSELTIAPRTRSMARMVKEQGGLNEINDEDFHTYLPKGKRAIGSKWVFQNKKDERGIVIRNKARLVSQGHTQKENIDYKEVFALVARIEAIRLFLVYASFMGFMVYQMDVKSAFLYETIKEEEYVCQSPGFEDPDYLDKVYKVVKALYGLHQAPRAWYETLANYLLENGFQRGKIDQTLFIKKKKGDILPIQVYVDDIIFGSTNKQLCKAFEKLMKDKFQMSSMGELTLFLGIQVKQKDDGILISHDKYVAEILRKFSLIDGRSASTPIDTEKPLLKDPDGEDVDVHIYRSMIVSLMYLTSSRPDIMFAVCACARFHVTPKVSHLHAVKRIFRWNWSYYWSPKVTTVRHFVTAVSYKLMLFSLTKDAAVHLMMLRHKSDASAGFDQIVDFLNAQVIHYALMVSLTIYVSCIKQFWATALIKKVNDVVKLQALIDRKKVVVTKDIIQQDIRLDDADGVECLPNEEIFAELARMGYEKPPSKLTFYKAFFSTQWKFLIHTLVQLVSAKRTS